MQEILEKCCGIDVHQESLTACIMVGSGKKMFKEIRQFSTMTNGLEELAKWLKEIGIKHVAIESTGIYWKPVFNILADDFEFILANARHIKNVPGRKTDIKDSEWICKLLKTGLLQKSFIPPCDIRNLRDLVRHRRKYVALIASEKNRIIKILESANLKLSSVLSDVFGVSGWRLINAILAGITDPKRLSKVISPICRSPLEEFEKALTGKITQHHIFLIGQAVNHIKHLEKTIEELDKTIEYITSQYKVEADLLKTIPGISEVSAAAIMAEIGVDMDQFPSDQHLSSWAGLCPGSYESAGKKRTNLTRLKIIKTNFS